MTKTYPLRQQILALPRAERAGPMLDLLQTWVADVTGCAKQEIAPTAPFTTFDESWADPSAMSEVLCLYFDKHLDFPFYLTDLEQAQTLQELASQIAAVLGYET